MWSLKKQLNKNKERAEARNKKNYEDFIKCMNRVRELRSLEARSHNARSE